VLYSLNITKIETVYSLVLPMQLVSTKTLINMEKIHFLVGTVEVYLK